MFVWLPERAMVAVDFDGLEMNDARDAADDDATAVVEGLVCAAGGSRLMLGDPVLGELMVEMVFV